MNLSVNAKSATETEIVGEKIGKRLKGGEVVELVSDLGGGKTTFVKGLAKGINSTDHVASPTFTVSKIYKGDNLELHHFDFYRLQDAGLMEHEIHDVIGNRDSVVVVEWGDAVSHVLPKNRLTIKFTVVGEDLRELMLSSLEPLDYLIEPLKPIT